MPDGHTLLVGSGSSLQTISPLPSGEQLRHATCRERCSRDLFCGHMCGGACHVGQPCPPCPKQCTVRCSHSKCGKQCHEVCAPCAHECRWSCSHQASLFGGWLVMMEECGHVCMHACSACLYKTGWRVLNTLRQPPCTAGCLPPALRRALHPPAMRPSLRAHAAVRPPLPLCVRRALPRRALLHRVRRPAAVGEADDSLLRCLSGICFASERVACRVSACCQADPCSAVLVAKDCPSDLPFRPPRLSHPGV